MRYRARRRTLTDQHSVIALHGPRRPGPVAAPGPAGAEARQWHVLAPGAGDDQRGPLVNRPGPELNRGKERG